MYRILFQRIPATRHAVRMIAFAAIFAVALSLGYVGQASAATLSFTTDATTPIPVGSTFTIDAHIESAEVGINAAQATIQFDPTVLNVVSVDTAGSVFGFWLVGPSFSNTKGTVSFIGGATDGFSGLSLQVIHLKMKAIAAGTAKVVFNDAAVAASDGSGTNVLDVTQSLELIVAGTTGSTTPPPASESPDSGALAPPSPSGVHAPSKPKVTVAAYPDQAIWYNVTQPFDAKWGLPKDVTTVAAVVNADARFEPKISIGKVSHKTFPAPREGRFYVHVRFMNEGGWGETTHYRLRIDLTPPTPVNVLDHDVLPSANPRPIIPATSTDALSGVKDVIVQLDGKASEVVNEEKYQPTEPLSPGLHALRFAARDNAGNVSYADAQLNIVPLGRPVIIAAKLQTIGNSEVVVATGTAKPSYVMTIALKDSANRELDSVITPVGRDGKWTAILNRPVVEGFYFVEATASDDSGARSFSVRSLPINIHSQEPALWADGFAVSYDTGARFFFSAASLLFALIFGLFLGRYQAKQRRLGLMKNNMNLRFFRLKHDLKDIIDRHAAAQTKEAGAVASGVKWDVYSRIDKELRDVHGDIEDIAKK